MSNALQKFVDLLPQNAEFVGSIEHESHPNYKVLVVDGSGLVLCTSTTRFYVGNWVFISGNEIKRGAVIGEVVQIEI
ncbi:hypothetical protein [Acinetobacter chinensis]|uniref:hypothetical protein n=1 Tax=Acinetobacter chinensis TaxID=2004650 RepID=UPI0029343899|nr:hypothetical protein [Acinetobacter chinensis]WOE40681.1 hypothetical protein QSG87_12410 [Acinetobacter chinensis]